MKRITTLFSVLLFSSFLVFLHNNNAFAESAYIKEYNKMMHSMHNDMMVKPSGNDQLDYLRQMIPHHQGAIDMSRAILKVAKDPELIKLANAIIVEQEKEIAQMKAMIARFSK
ncbi:MAG: DUF305 domain-containing protein [Desulfovibrionaceae bacterium]